MALDLLFSPQGGDSGGSSDYLETAFRDISENATNNTSLTSNSNTNPTGDFFANTDAPRYKAKSLFIKDMVLRTNPSTWIDNQPTYDIIFTEPYPAVQAYAFGNVTIGGADQYSANLMLRASGSGVALTSNARRLYWLINSGDSAAALDMSVDGTLLTSPVPQFSNELNFGGSVPKWVALDGSHSSSAKTPQSNDLHTYICRQNNGAGTFAPTTVVGLIVYHFVGTTGDEQGPNGVQQYPGTSYINRSAVTASVGVTLPAIGVSSFLGARAVVAKSSGANYSYTKTDVAMLSAAASGFSGTNQLAAATGLGGSFPLGSAILAQSGASSFFLTSVANQSTDTLTLFQTLPFEVSGGTLMRMWRTGQSLGVNGSTFEIDFICDLTKTNSAQVPQLFVDPEQRYWVSRMGASPLVASSFFGKDSEQISVEDKAYGWRLNFGTTNSIFNVWGRAAAMEMEFTFSEVTAAATAATLFVNGLPAAVGVSVATGQTYSTARILAYTDGPMGGNLVKMNVLPTSTSSAFLSKILFYRYKSPAGSSTSYTLGDYDIYPPHISRFQAGVSLAINYENTDLGMHDFHTPRQLRMTSGYTGVQTGTSQLPTGAFFGVGNTTIIRYSFFGDRFTVYGGNQGVTFLATVNGNAFPITVNSPNQLATLGFHDLVITNGLTTIIHGIVTGRSAGDMNDYQRYIPRGDIEIISGQQLPRNSIEIDRFAPRHVGYSVGLGGMARSIGAFTFSTGGSTLGVTIAIAGNTVMNLCIRTCGRPVFVGLNSDTIGNQYSGFGISGTLDSILESLKANLFIMRKRLDLVTSDVTVAVFNQRLNYNVATGISAAPVVTLPQPLHTHDYQCPAGIYSYYMIAQMDSTVPSTDDAVIGFEGWQLLAYEI